MAVVNTSPTILLLGGGYTLQRVAERLEPGSFIITSRSAEQCERWRQHGWLAGVVSVDDADGVRAIFAQNPGLKVVVDSVPPLRSGHGTDADAHAALGVRTVCQALEGTGVQRIIYLSTTGVFGVRDGSWVDETTPATPWNSQGAARLACEEVYRAASESSSQTGVQRVCTALRLPAIYGPDRGVAVSLRMGTYSLVGDGSQWTNRIHVEDLAEAIVRCIHYQGGLPPVLCINDDYPTQARDVVSYLCNREGLPWPPSVSPEEVLRRGAYTMLSNQRVRNALMKSVLGLSLQCPSFREGTER
jgi:nucleoside-diphosphate-sugar epimerase